MTEKIGTIKNPLTIIAIFAGIAEVSGTVVLPFITPANQSTFIWFLICFPTLLVVVFFLTLNLNNKVLYAPSDYKNEENYLTIFKYDVARQKNVEVEVSSNETYKLLSEQIQQQTLALNNKIMIVEKLISGKVHKEKDVDSIKVIKEEDVINQYKLQVVRFKDVNEFILMMKNKQYNFEVYDSSEDKNFQNLEHHRSIWLGRNIPLDLAKDIILHSKRFYSHLKFIHISGDLNEKAPIEIFNEIFIGGATSAAKRYGLQPMSDSDFSSLEKINSIKELHTFIRKFYP